MPIINYILLSILLFPLVMYAEDAPAPPTEQPPVEQAVEQPVAAPEPQTSEQPANQSIDEAETPANEEASDIPVVKLSPQIYREPLERPRPYTIPLHEIQPWLNRLRVMDKQDLNEAPKVVGFPKAYLLAGTDYEIYVTGLEDENPAIKEYEIFRIGRPYTDQKTGEILGYEANFMADATLIRPGEIAKLLVTSFADTVRVGDRLFPLQKSDMIESFTPTSVPFLVEGKIISVFDGIYEVGRDQVVAINLGQEDGLKLGHVLDIFQPGAQFCQPQIPLTAHMFDPQECDHNRTVTSYPAPELDRDPEVLFEQKSQDSCPTGQEPGCTTVDSGFIVGPYIDLRDVKPLKFPLEKVGYMMVFRIFDRVSYALIMRATDIIHVSDVVRSPGAEKIEQ